MPTYKVLSEEELQKWRGKLTELVNAILDAPTDESLRLLIVELFEYFQMFIGYRYKFNSEDRENVTVTYNDIKKNVEDTGTRYVLSYLNTIANAVRHNYASVNFKKYFSDLLSDSYDITKYCKEYLDGMEIVSNFFSDKKKFEVMCKEVYDRKNAYMECKDLVYKMLKSGFKLGDVVSRIESDTLYSKSFIKNIIFDILKDTYVEEGTLA